jgi:hypothetical protein
VTILRRLLLLSTILAIAAPALAVWAAPRHPRSIQHGRNRKGWG